MTGNRTCRECGKPYTVTPGQRGRPNRFYCSLACSRAFTNRAQLRGAQIYHLFRGLRRDRAEAKRLNVWTAMCQLETMWEDEDREAGRVTKSYRPIAEELDYLLDRRDLHPTTNVKEIRLFG